MLRKTIVFFKVYDHTEGSFIKTSKPYGRSLTKAQLPLGIAKFFPLTCSDIPRGQGLPRDLLRQVLQGLIADIEEIREAVRQTEMRMVASSLLVVYEADWDVLRENLQTWSREAPSYGGGEEDGEVGSSDSSDDTPGPPYLVKLIDFGHTTLREGDGPDTGVITGLDTTITLFKKRLEQVLHTKP